MIKKFNEWIDTDKDKSGKTDESSVITKMSELSDLFKDTKYSFSYEYENRYNVDRTIGRGIGAAYYEKALKSFNDSTLTITIDSNGHDWEIKSEDGFVSVIEVLNGRKESSSRYKYSNIDDALHLIEKTIHQILNISENTKNKKK